MATTLETTVKSTAGRRIAAAETANQRKWQRAVLLTVLGYEGVGALLGGSLLIARPDGRLMAMPVEIMHGTFTDFLIPGIILFGLGVLTTAAFAAVLRRSPSDWIYATVSLLSLLVWFWIEIAILREIHWLHAMWGLPVVVGVIAAIPIAPTRTLLTALLMSGIVSTVLYVGINVIVPAQWKGYSVVSQTVSELSAVGAPTRTLWVTLTAVYTVLVLCFAIGVWKVAEGNRRLRIAAGLLIAYGVLGLLWPFAPMHLRETLAAGGGTISDTLHIMLGVATEIFYLLALGFAAAALGKNFAAYSVVTLLLVLFFGVLTFLDAPAMARNEPTPFIGIWERINIALFMGWIVVLAMVLLRKHSPTLTPGHLNT